MTKIYLFVLIALTMLTVSCSQPKQLVYQDVRNFRVGKLTLDMPEVGMDLQFYNPNDYGLTLKDANIDVYINNTLIGKAALTNAFSVPARDTFLMPVNLTADLKNVLPNALQILFNKEVEVTLHGNVKAGKGIFINIPVDYRGKQRLNVF